jgi:transposase
MARTRRTYSREFKLEAVRLLEASGKSIIEIEQELGIGHGCLCRWRKKPASDGEEAFPGHGRLTAEQEEIRQLKRVLEIARQERDIPKRLSPSSRNKSRKV